MKKVLLTAVVALSTLVASAQFMVVTTYDGDQEENADKLTANMGVGYVVNDAFTVGLAKGADVITAADAVAGTVADTADGYSVWARYNLSMMEGAYVALDYPTENGSDNMKIGLGFAFNIWNSVYIEPNYMMPTSKDENDKREGQFNFGISFRF